MSILPIVGIGAIVTGVLGFLYSKGKTAEKTPITYTQFTEQLSRQIDNYMLEEEKKKGVIMAGGECEIKIPENDPENVVMNIALYSQKSTGDDKWIKSSITQKMGISEFAKDSETQEKLSSLRNKAEKFKIARPEKE